MKVFDKAKDKILEPINRIYAIAVTAITIAIFALILVVWDANR